MDPFITKLTKDLIVASYNRYAALVANPKFRHGSSWPSSKPASFLTQLKGSFPDLNPWPVEYKRDKWQAKRCGLNLGVWPMTNCLRSLLLQRKLMSRIRLRYIRMTRHSTRQVRIYSALSLMLSEVFPLISWQQSFLPKMDAYTCLWSAHFRASNDDLLFTPACNSNLSLTSQSFPSVDNILHALHGINYRKWEKRRLQLCFRYLCPEPGKRS